LEKWERDRGIGGGGRETGGECEREIERKREEKRGRWAKDTRWEREREKGERGKRERETE